MVNPAVQGFNAVRDWDTTGALCAFFIMQREVTDGSYEEGTTEKVCVQVYFRGGVNAAALRVYDGETLLKTIVVEAFSADMTRSVKLQVRIGVRPRATDAHSGQSPRHSNPKQRVKMPRAVQHHKQRSLTCPRTTPP